MSNKWKVFWISSLVFVVLFQACGMHSWEEVVISKADEKRMGREYDSLIKIGHKDVMAAGEKIFVPSTPEQQDLYNFYQARAKEVVNVIRSKDLEALLPGTNECNKKKCTKDNFFEFKLINSKQVNAFAVPGGYVYFYTPILKEFKSESELVGVIAHEVGHIVLHHTRERMVKAIGASAIIDALLGDGVGALLASVGTNIWLMQHSQENEFEADSMGFYYANEIKISPLGLGHFFARGLKSYSYETGACDEKKEGTVLDVFSTHPPSCERVNRNRKQVEKSGNNWPLDKNAENGKNFVQLVKAAGI